jgi:hypothetical protein
MRCAYEPGMSDRAGQVLDVTALGVMDRLRAGVVAEAALGELEAGALVPVVGAQGDDVRSAVKRSWQLSKGLHSGFACASGRGGQLRESPNRGSNGSWSDLQTVPRRGARSSTRYLLVVRVTQALGSASLVCP